MMKQAQPIVIIGAGPAGIAAATMIADAGHRPVMIDEGRAAGGQIFRQPHPEFLRPPGDIYGFDARREQAFRADVADLNPAVDYRSETTVWSAETGLLHLANRGRAFVQPWSRLIVAAGAMDRVLPTEGWTAPGVYSLGGAQISLKAEASLIGRNVIFAGTGPLLYLVAYQYAKAGANVPAVLETAKPFDNLSLLPALASGGATFARGLYYIAWLHARGIPVLTGVVPLEVTRAGDGRVNGLAFRHGARRLFLGCDALALGHGLKAETQIADLLGVDFYFNSQQRQWLPTIDMDGRSSIPNVYLAGDGASVRGSAVAAASGRLAASALLRDAGHRDEGIASRDRRMIARSMRFRNALDRAFPFPSDIAGTLPDKTMICRCEGLTAGDIRHTVVTSGEFDINRIKAFCRLGMGRCQGRICGPAATELIATVARIDVSAVGRLRGQAPIKPIPLRDLTEVGA
ncbi:NADPH-dependent 2,4-dienoyl-CoA reductase/sulfur reductase-like enzyme [Rhizobium sp. BK650]|uniref:FAD/NAD(P)-dependent oxidoreductase n=1 Tax=Rhizobium sp. BK650 TaxID=2586990 RepID=UPI00181231D3|nr:NAD(P)/FAD-dependent oxidoreductase [Rhizobium sp. BK650]MBB3659729.1 NADPH-dependent 2,4-dienoyl-CoA reductase/sulfur reductase-like enzyme [Rhizobium sp. BK650]